MIIFFDDEALEELYSTGRTSDKKYKRLQSGVMRKRRAICKDKNMFG